MAELSSHSYHYKNSVYNQQDNDSRSDDDESGSKKKQRRRKRMLTGVSKQRRAANERERKRLQIINSAYKELKSTLPLFPNETNIPKIEIVRLATKTIQYLSDILNKTSANDVDHMRAHHSCSEYTDVSELSSEDSFCNIGDLSEDIKLDTIDTDDLDISNLLFQQEDIKLESDLIPPYPSDTDGSSMSSDGFCGLDITTFLATPSSHLKPPEEVYPRMLYR